MLGDREELFLPILPYHVGSLPVGDGHSVYYEECGNPHGVPVVYLHGGPGSGCDRDARRLFHPEKCNVLLYDQRGCGRSIPLGDIEHNTTHDLVEDLEKLLNALGKERVVLFGGSWGATLALMFAISHPERVSGIVLRGTFLSEQEELQDYLEGRPATFFPESWERFAAQIPKRNRWNPVGYYLDKMENGNETEKRYYAYEWAYYEASRLYRIQKSKEEIKKSILGDSMNDAYLYGALIEAHYFKSVGFITKHYIMRHVGRVPQVPIIIIHGRYDDICPVTNAYRLHEALPWSKLCIVDAGHARSEPEIQKALILETDAMVSRLM